MTFEIEGIDQIESVTGPAADRGGAKQSCVKPNAHDLSEN